jgi:hypothetical protein
MPSTSDRALTERSGRELAERLRPSLRLRPRLEVLETRCLLSGGHLGSEYDHGTPLPSRGPAVAAKSIASHGLDRRSVRLPVTSGGYDAGSAPSVDGDRSEYGVGVSRSNAATLPGLPGLPQASYVVVPETNAPHHTLATAQKLPNLPYVGVVGTLGSGDPIDLYRVTLSSGAVGLNFGLESDQSAQTVPMQLQVFDGWGHMLGEWSLDGQSTTSVYGGLGALPAGSTLYFGITAGTPSGLAGPSTAIGYQLWVARQASPSSTTASSAEPTGPPSAIAPIASPLPASTGPGAQPSNGVSPATPTSPPNESGGLLVAVGSPAMRSARPSGGLLSDGDPAPPAASDFNAVVNKEWDERSPTGPMLSQGRDVESTTLSGREREPEALVVINGPGGFRLLGAVALGHRRKNPATVIGDFATPSVLSDGNSEHATQELLANADSPVTEEGVTDQSRSPHGRPWGRFPVSVFSGLGLATIFTLNSVLSQPIAGFDYLTSHMDPGGGPRPFRRNRLRKSASPPGV